MGLLSRLLAVAIHTYRWLHTVFKAIGEVAKGFWDIIKALWVPVKGVWQIVEALWRYIEPVLEELRVFRDSIFYEKPIKYAPQNLTYYGLNQFYKKVTIIFLCLWGYPWASFLAWYTTVKYGCQWTATREFLEPICLGPHLGRTIADRPLWYLDLWEPQNVSTDDLEYTIPVFVERLMTAHMRMKHSATALQYGMAKTANIAPELVTGTTLEDSGMLTTLPLMYTIDTDFQSAQVVEIATVLFPYYENFSRTFCKEKDTLNHEFRNFLESFIRAVSKGPYEDISIIKTILIPLWEHVSRLVNHYLLSTHFPKPVLYSVQVKSEIQFHLRLFVRNSLAALDRIEASFSTVESLLDEHSLYWSLDKLLEKLKVQQENVKRTISDLKSTSLSESLVLLGSNRRKEKIQTYEEHYARGERIRGSIFTLWETIHDFRKDNNRLRAEIRDFRIGYKSDALYDISSQGLVALPPKVQAAIPKAPWVTPDNGSNELFRYDLHEVDDAEISDLRNTIAQLCQEHGNYNLVSGSLYMVCRVWNYAKAMSAFDDALLDGVQRSWVLARIHAIRRFEKEIGADLEEIARLTEIVYGNYRRGAAVPDYLPHSKASPPRWEL